MKKIIAFALALVMVLSLAACAGPEQSAESNTIKVAAIDCSSIRGRNRHQG